MLEHNPKIFYWIYSYGDIRDEPDLARGHGRPLEALGLKVPLPYLGGGHYYRALAVAAVLSVQAL